MKKLLFIDRDGTLVVEPKNDFQVDSFEKLEFLPGVFNWLKKIVDHLDYELVMVTNQDGLGTGSFPENTFWPVQNFMVNALANEGITFSAIHIDRTFEDENAPTRKPGIGMLNQYLVGDYDLKNSFVIGDRKTDLLLAKNLGAKAILFESSFTSDLDSDATTTKVNTWKDVYSFLRLSSRRVTHKRVTNETAIEIEIDLDGTGKAEIKTGLSFFDHMLDQLARHSGIDLKLNAKGDLHIDEHHTIEDVAIALGEAFSLALTDKAGMERYGFCLPMDDCLAQVAVDFGGRSWLAWDVKFSREKIGDFPVEMFFHFFKSFSDAAKCNLNIQASGENEHHKAESIFKALAKSFKMALKRDVTKMVLPTTKGLI